MTKKNKKNKISWDSFIYPPIEADKEGDLRFYQKDYYQEKDSFWGWTLKSLKKGPKILQRFDGKDWVDIPEHYEAVYI
jgi:hypothetical protein